MLIILFLWIHSSPTHSFPDDERQLFHAPSSLQLMMSRLHKRVAIWFHTFLPIMIYHQDVSWWKVSLNSSSSFYVVKSETNGKPRFASFHSVDEKEMRGVRMSLMVKGSRFPIIVLKIIIVVPSSSGNSHISSSSHLIFCLFIICSFFSYFKSISFPSFEKSEGRTRDSSASSLMIWLNDEWKLNSGGLQQDKRRGESQDALSPHLFFVQMVRMMHTFWTRHDEEDGDDHPMITI